MKADMVAGLTDCLTGRWKARATVMFRQHTPYAVSMHCLLALVAIFNNPDMRLLWLFPCRWILGQISSLVIYLSSSHQSTSNVRCADA